MTDLSNEALEIWKLAQTHYSDEPEFITALRQQLAAAEAAALERAAEVAMSSGPSYFMAQTGSGFKETHTKLGAFAFRTDIRDAIRALITTEAASALEAVKAQTRNEAVKVKPLVFVADDEDPDRVTAGDYDIYHEGHGYQVYFWSIVTGDPCRTLADAEAFVWRHHEARIRAQLEGTTQ